MPSLSQLTVKQILSQGPANEQEVSDQASLARGLAPETAPPSFRRGTVGHLVRSELGGLESRARAAGARGDTDTVNQILGEMNSLIDSNRGVLESAAGYTGGNAHQQDVAARAQRFITGDFMNGGDQPGSSLYEMADENSEQAQKYRAMRVRQGGDLGAVARLSESNDGFTQYKLASLGYGRNADPTLIFTPDGEEDRSRDLATLSRANARASAYGGEVEAYYNAYKWNVDSFAGGDGETYTGAGYDDDVVQFLETFTNGPLTNSNITSATTELNRLANSFFSDSGESVTKVNGAMIARQGDTPLFHQPSRDKRLFLDAAWAARALAHEWAGGVELSPEDARSKMEILMTPEFRDALQEMEAAGAFASASDLERRRKIIEFSRSYMYDKAPDLTPNFQGYDPFWNANKAGKGLQAFFDTEEQRELQAINDPARQPTEEQGTQYDLTTADSDAENALALRMSAVSNTIKRYLPVFARKGGAPTSHRQFVTAMLNDSDTFKHLATEVAEQLGTTDELAGCLLREVSRQMSANPSGVFDYNAAFEAMTHAGLNAETLRESAGKHHAAVTQWNESAHLQPTERRDSYTTVFQQTQGIDPKTIQLIDLATGDFSGDFVDHGVALDNSARVASSLGRITDGDARSLAHSMMSTFRQCLSTESKAQAEQRAQLAKAAAENPDADPFSGDPTAPNTSAEDSAWQAFLGKAGTVALPGNISSKAESIKALWENAITGADSPELQQQADFFRQAILAGNLDVAAETLKALVDSRARTSFNGKDDPVRVDANIKLLRDATAHDFSFFAHKYAKVLTVSQRKELAASFNEALELVSAAVKDGRVNVADFSTVGDPVNGPGQAFDHLLTHLSKTNPQAAHTLMDKMFGIMGVDEPTRKLYSFYMQSNATQARLSEAVASWQSDRNDEWLDDDPNLVSGWALGPAAGAGTTTALLKNGLKSPYGWAATGLTVGTGALGYSMDRGLAKGDGKPRDKVKMADLAESNPLRQMWQNAGFDMNTLVEHDFATTDNLNGSPWGRFFKSFSVGSGAGATVGSFFGESGALIGAAIGGLGSGLTQAVQDIFFTPGEEDRKDQLASFMETQTLELARTFSGTPIEGVVSGRLEQLQQHLRNNPDLDVGERGNLWARTYAAISKEAENAARSLLNGDDPKRRILQLFGGDASAREAAQVEAQATQLAEQILHRFSATGTAKDESQAKAMYAFLTQDLRKDGNKRILRAVNKFEKKYLPGTSSGKDPGFRASVMENFTALYDKKVTQSRDGEALTTNQIESCYREAIALTTAQYQQAAQDAKLAQIRMQERIKHDNKVAQLKLTAETELNNKLAVLDARNQAARDKAREDHERKLQLQREDHERKLQLQRNEQSHRVAMESAKHSADNDGDFMSAYQSAFNNPSSPQGQ